MLLSDLLCVHALSLLFPGRLIIYKDCRLYIRQPFRNPYDSQKSLVLTALLETVCMP